MAWKYNERIIRIGRSWTDDNGVTHPRNWASVWDDDVKVSFGLEWEEEPASFDSRFYWDANTPKEINDTNEVDEDGNQVVTKGLKSNAIAQTKTTAGGLLSPTDWMVTRQAETGTEVPSSVSDYRAAVRTASEAIETAIAACGTVEQFMALYDAPVDADGNVTGNAPINDWPEAI
jgi:hypothetical protein